MKEMIILEVPVENSIDKLGCRKAPSQILSYIEDSYIAENGSKVYKESINFKKLEFSGKSEREVSEVLYEEALDLIKNHDKCVFVGGDHSISYSVGKAFMENCLSEGSDPCIIVFDAHPDCKNDFGNTGWLKNLIDGGFPKDKVIIVGLRKSSSEEMGFLQEKKIRTYNMKDINDIQEICDIVMELANKNQIYISIDVDVLDSVFVPGTARPESGGMTTRQLLYFIQRLNLLKNVRVIDITEINPELDFRDVTVKLGSKIIEEILS